MASLNATASPTSNATPDPTTPSYSDDLEWITAYLTIHVLSDASTVYTYILWIVVAAVLVICSFSHITHLRSGYYGAYWSKWSLRRRTWRKKHSLAVAARTGQPHRQPTALPSNAQILSLTLIIVASLVLCFVGPDYLAPGSTLWNTWTSPPASVSGRAAAPAPAPYDASTFAPYQPQYTIPKAWWTSGNRTGLIAFALFPLCVLLALKAPPFAIFSLPFMVQLHFDKLAWLHRWSGRLIWFITTLHVAFWSVQLLIDHRTVTGKVAYTYAWDFPRFIYAWVAYASMTLLILFSLHWVRHHHYEIFYVSHIILIPVTIVMSAYHHPQVWWWCGAALFLWAGERIWRAVWWLHTNGYFGGMQPPSKLHKASRPTPPNKPEAWQMQQLSSPVDKSMTPSPTTPSALLSPGAPPPTKYVPPPGFAHAELLTGRTIRVRLVTPGYLSWAPGQHFLLRIPSVNPWVTHPFTVASVCDAQASDEGRELYFFIRAKNGWTKSLWDTIAQTVARGQARMHGEKLPPGAKLPSQGVLMRATVDGPFGSAERAHWGSYSSVLIVAGGSGVSFGLSVLQYMCMRLAGRDGQYLGGQRGGWGHPGFRTKRVRFVWLVREFGHIQWCASQLRKCRAMIPSPELQIDIFVTNVKPTAHPQPSLASHSNIALPSSPDGLTPPTPRPRRQEKEEKQRTHVRTGSVSSATSDDADVDLSYYTGGYVADNGELGHEEHILDLTNFEGDSDFMLPGEARLSMNIKLEGHRRRADTRRKSQIMLSKQEYSGGNTSSAHLLEPRARISHLHDVTEDVVAEEDVSNVKIARNMLSPLSAPPIVTDVEPRSTRPPSLSQLQFAELATSSAAPLPHPRSSLSTPATLSPASPYSPSSQSSRPASVHSGYSDTHSMVGLMQEDWTRLRLELDDQEMQDLLVVAEHARPGKPKLDHILADEVRQAQGSIVVGCCGPTSLNAVIRKVIAAQIDPGRIRAGDMRGSISLVAEDFEY
ncbi:hypothetical protein B0H21DRAFT_716267 [Amylocystis lapponica]|nr:hypothetical protein B0H21DRAFT_716267 [Amylocystis lapponica]